MVFKKDKDREKGAQLIRDEAQKINNLFLRLSHATTPKVHIGGVSSYPNVGGDDAYMPQGILMCTCMWG